MWPFPDPLPLRQTPASRLRSITCTVLVVVTALVVASCSTAPAANGVGPSAQPSPAASSAGSSSPTAPASASPTASASTSTAPVPAKLSAQTAKSAGTILTSLLDHTGPRDPRYYRAGVFHDGTPTCLRCTMGPAVLAATYGVVKSDPQSVRIAIAVFDRTIAQHQQKDGSITPPGPGEGGPGIQTILFGNALAHTYLVLGPELDAKHRKQWARSLTKSADYLINSRTPEFYVNGNINLSISMNLDLTYRITKLSRFHRAAKRSLAFTLHPPQDRWRGFGLTYSHKPTMSSGADGAGYLAESGGAAPGFDPAYSLYQVDIASLWFSLTGRPDLKRLTNLIFNQLYPLVRTSDWTIDVNGGTRRGAPGTRYGFTVSALPVLALKGGRDDLRGLVSSQAAAVDREFTKATTFSHPGLSDSFGSELAVSLAAICGAPG